MEEGCFGNSILTAPRKQFAVEVDAQGVAPSVQIYWKRNGAWDWSIPGVSIRLGEAGPDKWRHAFGLIRVPEGADELVLMLSVRQAEGERTWFDNVSIYPLSDL